MKMKLDIKTVQVDVKTGTSKKGRPYSFRIQTGYLHVPNEPFPVKFKFMLGDVQEALQVGPAEVLLDESIYLNAYGEMQVRPVVRSVAQAKA